MSGPDVLVRLEGVPASAYVAADDHLRSLLRELSLIRIGLLEEGEGSGDHVPLPVLVLIDELATSAASVTARGRALAEAAVDAGTPTFTLELEADDATAELNSRLVELLEHADRLCAEDHLLTLPAPPEVAQLRRDLARRVQDAVVGSADA